MSPTRRTLLVGIGATTVLSGCLGDDDADDGDPVDDDADDADDDADDADPTEEDDTNDDDAPDDTDDTDGDEPATVQVASHPDYGDILVDGDGLTLYMFDVDERGAGASECRDECADNWPPLIADDPSAGADVTAALTTFEREDGETQVAAYGWPLYFWVGDDEPGDTNGQGVNDVWWVMAPDGTPIRDEPDDDGATDDDTEEDDDGETDGDADDDGGGGPGY